MARSSVKIGIFMMLAWVIPLVGILVAVFGLTQAIVSYSTANSAMARAGIFLNSLGLLMSLMLVFVTVYLLFSGTIDIQSIVN